MNVKNCIFKSNFDIHKIKRWKNEPISYYLDYAIIEGVSYTIPQRIPNGYISFGIEDFEIRPEENIEITLGPGVYADVIYRVLEETYELIDTKTFDRKITQVLVDGSGQSSSSFAILYLMEDGTVIDLRDAFFKTGNF